MHLERDLEERRRRCLSRNAMRSCWPPSITPDPPATVTTTEK
jgi:hypothetical protein